MASWDTQRKEAAGIRGGPLPTGFYRVHRPAAHGSLGNAAYLEQTLTSLLYVKHSASAGVAATERGGFFIHARGPKGSDGCIVPMEKFDHLMTLLAAHAPVMLQVVSTGVRTDKLPPPVPGNLA
jgi:hypothetical protein